MEHRTSAYMVVLALLAVSGFSAAQDASVRASFSADDSPRSDATNEPDRATFALGTDAPVKRVAPGGNVTFVVYAKARENLTLQLESQAPDGWRVLLEPSLEVGPDTRTQTRLVLHAPANASGQTVFGIVATARGTDETHALRLSVHVAERPDCATAASCKPDPRCRPADARTHEPATTRPCLARDPVEPRRAPCDAATHDCAKPPFRMTLSQERAVAYVGDDGIARGRVAVLIEGGREDGSARLGVRMLDDAPWRAHLEKERISVDAHEREWVWLHFEGRAGAPPLRYAVIGHSVDGNVLAHGGIAIADGASPTADDTV